MLGHSTTTVATDGRSHDGNEHMVTVYELSAVMKITCCDSAKYSGLGNMCSGSSMAERSSH